MPIYNETFSETWEKVDRINAAKKLLRENGYEVIKIVDTNKRCKYIKREGESCTLNNNCTYPNCKELHQKK